MPTDWERADLGALKISREVAAYMAERGYAVPSCPPAIKTPEPGELRSDAVFSFDAVDRVVRSFKRLRHTKGRFAGQAFIPDPWQVAYYLAPVFGWLAPSEDTGALARIVTEVWIELPRKNGKSTVAGGTAVYLTGGDGEPGAQVVCAATQKDQARFVFDPIKQVIGASPGLKKHFQPFQTKIIHKPSGSYMQVVASGADAQHGADLHGGIVDEVHLHKSYELIEAIETGTGSRVQPLLLLITTADAGKRHTIYDRKRERIEKLARRVLKDPTTYGVVWAAEADDDPFAESTWIKANPGYGVSPTKRFMAQAALKAANSAVELASFQRLHLGIRTKQVFRFLDLDAWDRNASMIVAERLKGRQCWGGLDLASTSDLTALAWVFPEGDAFDVLVRCWAPEDALEQLDGRTAGAASDWVKGGFLTLTPGNVTDYDWIRRQIGRDRDEFAVKELVYDRWNATQLAGQLVEDGAPVATMGQGYASMSAPTKDLQRLLLSGTPERPVLRHGGNPLLRWMVDNFAVEMDDAGNVKPSKKQAADKIDGVVALIMGLSRALAAREPTRRSAYEDGGLMIV